MELKSFIEDALVQIASGVISANKQMHEKGMEEYENSPFRLYRNLGDHAKDYPGVDFDVGVSVQSDSKVDGGAKLAVLNVVNIGGGAETSDSHSIQHRIKFSVGLHQNVD
jgi:hypothetical protein